LWCGTVYAIRSQVASLVPAGWQPTYPAESPLASHQAT
jgi:hypothetical protein